MPYACVRLCLNYANPSRVSLVLNRNLFIDACSTFNKRCVSKTKS